MRCGPCIRVSTVNEAAGEIGQAESPMPKGRRGFLSRWLRRLAILAGLLATLVSALYVTRERTLHPLLVRYMPRLSRALGPYEVSVQGIQGDWRHGLEVAGLRVAALGAEQRLRSIEAEAIEIRGSILRSAWDRNASAITSVKVVAPAVHIDSTLSAGPDGPSAGPLIPPGLPSIELERGDLTVVTLGSTIRVGDISIAGRGERDAPWAVSFFAQTGDWSGAIEGSVFGTGDETGSNEVAVDLDVPGGTARGVDVAIDSLRANWSRERLTLRSGTVTAGTNLLTIAGVTVSGKGTATVAGGRVGFEFPDIGDARRALSAFVGPRDYQPKSWSGRARGHFDLLEAPGQIATGAIQVRGDGVVLEGVELGSVEARLDVERGAITVTELFARSRQGTMLDASGSYLIATRELLKGRLGVRMERPGTLAPHLNWARGVDMSIFLTGPLDRPSGRLSVRVDRVIAGTTELRQLQAIGTLEEGVLLLEEGSADTAYGTVALGGRVVLPLAGANLDITLERLRLSEGKAQLDLQEPARVGIDGDSVRISGLSLAGTAGALVVDYEGGGSQAPTARVLMKSLRPGPFLRDKLSEWMGTAVDPGTLDGRLEFSSAPLHAEADILVSVDPSAILQLGARGPSSPRPKPIEGKVRGSWDGSTVDLQELHIDMPGARLDMTVQASLGDSAAPASGRRPGFVVHRDGPFAINGSFDLEESWLRSPLGAFVLGIKSAKLATSARGNVDGTVKLRGTWGQPSGTISLNGTDLEWVHRATGNSARADSTQPGRSLLPRPVRLQALIGVGEQLTVESGLLELVDCVRLDMGGSLATGLDLAALAEDPAQWVQDVLSSPLSGRATLASEGLEEFSVLMPELRETSGQVSGEVRIAGSLEMPLVTGEIKIAEAGARFRGVPPIENANIGIVIEQDQIRVTRGSLEIGASPVRFEGSVLLGQGSPRIDATITGDEVLLVRTADARIRADLNLKIAGRTNALVLGGDVLITGGRVRSPIEFQSLIEGKSGTPRSVARGFKIPAFGPPSLRLDTRIRTEKPLAIRGRIARGGIRTDIRLTGTAAAPAPVGSVFFDPLELAVPAGTIVFPSGLVQFDRNSPEIPRIDIVGTTRLAGYDVTVSVEGDYDQPAVELSSSPSLAADDLLLLVLSGQPPNSGGGLEAAGQSVALYVAKDLVRGWFSSGGFEEEDRESFLERFDVVTGRDVSRSGVLTIEATYKIRQGLARDNDALYMVLERDAYEDYRLGVRLVLRLP